MSKQSWRGSTLLNPEPPVLVSCGGLEQPNLITIGWTGTICTQPSMVSISVRPERYSHHLIKESGQFAINLPTEQLVRAVDWCGVKSGRDVDKFAACGLHLFHGLDHRRAGAGLTKGNKGIVEIACQKLILHSFLPRPSPPSQLLRQESAELFQEPQLAPPFGGAGKAEGFD